MVEQTILKADNGYKELDAYLESNAIRSIFLVCGSSIKYTKLQNYFEQLSVQKQINVIRFSDFSPNPTYESVVSGVDLFRKTPCDLIIAVGGGSAIDVAKCIKLYVNMDKNSNYLEQTIIPNDIPFLVVPTTAGTGSESTRFAVIYYQGEKQSVTHESCIPKVVLFDASTLETLPEYQKKATMLDALCHAIESLWSVNSTEESRIISKQAIQLILQNMQAYFANDDVGNEQMLVASNLAGKAINITQTTAGHAMCYKLTSLYGISHGHAAALCVKVLMRYMYENLDLCIDVRGKIYLETVFSELSKAMGYQNVDEGITYFEQLIDSLQLEIPEMKENDLEILCSSVNPVRLKNHPIKLDMDVIRELYCRILKTNR